MDALSLDGAWEFRRVGDEQWMPAEVPGGNFTDLLANGKIPDPFVADNEKSVRWVIESDWEYRRRFDVSEEMLAADRVRLECEGLDTLATIFVNGAEVATSDNMFHAHHFDVKKHLQAGENEVLIRFQSPVTYAREFKGRQPFAPPMHSLKAGPYVRKAICHFGWDWGPQLPPCGIWRPIRLVARSVARLAEVHVRQRHSKGNVTVSARVRPERWSKEKLRVEMSLKRRGVRPQQVEAEMTARASDKTLRIDVDNPKHWWPAGYGDQPLYELEVRLLDADGNELDVDRKRIGLRDIKLRRRKDRHGEEFRFVVNGVPIFAKGANWIPADSFPTRVGDEQYRYLLQGAVDANMNMIRVWGGGFYENDAFYDLCDELGLLVWQDFLFACSVYRSDREFIDNVRREVIAGVRRLRHRACVALWCGNNEMDWAWDQWGWKDRYPAEDKKAYDKLFHRDMPKWVAAEDPDRTHWHSSPTSGDSSDNANGEQAGDGHDWSVWHGKAPFTDFRDHHFRFMSEFGMQSLPEIDTVATFARPQDWNMTSYIMEHHQRSEVGNGLIVYYLTQNFRLPRGFDALCYVTQLLQLEAVRYGVEHWRRSMRRCGGTLYWQLNDCWPVASWSSIDYFGRWKALHYGARRFYAPVMLSAMEEGTRVELHVTNDTLAPAAGEVRWRLMTLDGELLDSGESDARVSAQSNMLIDALEFGGVVNDGNRRNVVLAFELVDKRGQRVSEGMVTFAPNKHLELVDPQIDAKLTSAGDEWKVELTAKSAARFVEVRLKGVDAVWSDNYFDIPAGDTRTVTCPRAGKMTRKDARGRLRIRSLWDSF